MPVSQSAPELRLERDDDRLRLESPTSPNARGRLAFRAFFFGGPILMVALWSVGWAAGAVAGALRLGCLVGGLGHLLAMALLITWVATLSGDKLLRELEVDREAGRLRVRGSSYGGLFGRDTELDARSVRTLRIETPLPVRSMGIRWGELLWWVREHWGEKAPPYPGAEREMEEAVLIRTPVLRLVVEAAGGVRSTFLFRVEGVRKGGHVRELLERIAGALDLPVIELEWSDERKVSVRAGWERRATRVAEEAATGSLPDRLPPVGAGSRLPQNRILVWEPGQRIVFRTRFGRVWLFFLWPVVLVTSWPVIGWLAESLASTGPGHSVWEAWMRQWPLNFLLVVPLGLALLVSLWLGRPRRSEIDWTAGVARHQGRLRRRELPLSEIETVLLREDHNTVREEVNDPYLFTVELVPRESSGGKPLMLVAAKTIHERRREEIHRALAPLAAALARFLDVPHRMRPKSRTVSTPRST